jgi:cytochrome c peroxidase
MMGLTCTSCHDIHSTVDRRQKQIHGGSILPFNIPTIFNAALSFRLNWEGNFRALEAQTESSLENTANLATNAKEVLKKLDADPEMVRQFTKAYGHPADRASLLDAIATHEQSLLTPGSRFDRWLGGAPFALGGRAARLRGIRHQRISCHQGVCSAAIIPAARHLSPSQHPTPICATCATQATTPATSTPAALRPRRCAG